MRFTRRNIYAPHGMETVSQGVYTIHGLFTEQDLEDFENIIDQGNSCTRTFTNSPFKNGKVVMPDVSQRMWDVISPHLPQFYTDTHSVEYKFVGVPTCIMYAEIQAGQHFGLHTDTGCVYDKQNGKYSKFTFLTYLNDDFVGGATQFYDASFKKTVSIHPERNKTLLFDIDLFHQGCAVVSGRKRWIGSELVCRALTLKT